MRIPWYQVDAFACQPFSGNPAAVCWLDSWLPDFTLQAIAEENNLAETAFFVQSGQGFELRWFTPVAEVDLCGHATLATAHVLLRELQLVAGAVEFQTRSGRLGVVLRGELLVMDFPAELPKPCAPPEALLQGLGRLPDEVLVASDYLAVFPDAPSVRALVPDLSKLASLGYRGVCVTAPGEETDFISRFFAPKLGVPEDPVTGSAHCQLAPYWAARLGKTALKGFQASRRGGEVGCELQGDRVLLSGQACTVLEGTLRLD